MPHIWLNLFIFIFMYLVTCSSLSLSSNETSSTEKKFKTAIYHKNNLSSNSNISESLNSKHKTETKAQDEHFESKILFQSFPNDTDIPESYKMAFYFFIGLSIAGIMVILLKIYRMRLSRAERKYGVHGDRSTQELTPLPMAIEEDSDNEDHTVFDINKQIRVS